MKYLEGKRVARREGAQAHQSLSDGNAGSLHEFPQLLRSVQAAAADVEDRPLRLQNRFSPLIHAKPKVVALATHCVKECMGGPGGSPDAPAKFNACKAPKGIASM